jgi:hypothetical protein
LSEQLHPQAPHHLPIFITAPDETDVLIAVADQDAGAERSLIEVQGKKPMIVLRNLVLVTAIMAGSALLSLQELNAFELTGAWATSADQCGKIFARKGRAKQLNFTNFSSVYGGGFIAEANRLRGKFEICSIKSRKESGQTINLVVACASGIMLSNVQFFLKVLDDDTISREFPGMEGMEVTYHRCQI